MMREVWKAPSGQPFIIAGSGTLAMDIAGSNLIEPGDKALVISTGYFGERYAELLGRYGAEVTVLRADTGDSVDSKTIEETLKKNNFKLLTFTHVDTSTAVKVDPIMIGELTRKYNVISVLDGVCSVAGEEIRQDEWGIDVVLTASQKAVGVPPGLALLVASEKAINAWRTRKSKVGNYYADWTNWLPIMEAYEQRRPSYFGTPAVNLVQGLEASLRLILEEGMEKRFARHSLLSSAFREGIKAMGLEMIPVRENLMASTLSAIYYPDNSNGPDIIKGINQEGVIVAGGLLTGLSSEYFRVGHMGSVNGSDILSTLAAIEKSMIANGLKIPAGASLSAAQNFLIKEL